jgi:ribonuclease BN (tRNA processing enzyme)
MKLQFVGCGDAFGSGGRLNTCFHVRGESANFLIDCGASSLIGLKRLDIDRNAIQAIFVTHFHADHFAGLPFFILDAQFFTRRTEPLSIIGPTGLTDWYERVMETAFPGSSRTLPKFRLSLHELRAGEQLSVAGVDAYAFQAHHGNPGGPFLALRLVVEGKVIAYTGDSEWTEGLVDAGHLADVFIAEAYFFDKKVKLHLDLETLEQNLHRVRPRRLILTHMSEDMLCRVAKLRYECAHDGLLIDV